jgi:hypothetical protein
MRIQETRDATDDVDVVARQLIPDDVDLALDHLPCPHAEVLDRDLVLDPVGLAVDGALGEAGEVHDGFAQGFGRDRPQVDRAPAERPPFDHRRAHAQLRRLDGRFLPGGPGANHEEVVVAAVFHGSNRTTQPAARFTQRAAA